MLNIAKLRQGIVLLYNTATHVQLKLHKVKTSKCRNIKIKSEWQQS